MQAEFIAELKTQVFAIPANGKSHGAKKQGVSFGKRLIEAIPHVQGSSYGATGFAIRP